MPAAVCNCYGLLSPYRVWASIQEGHVPHRLRLILRVHQNSVPAVQDDGLVVGVADTATHIDAGITPHRSPAPALGLRVVGEHPLIRGLGHAVRVARADVDRLTTGAVAEIGPMRLAAVAPGERLASEDQLLVHNEADFRQEEPFTLANIRSVFASAASLALDALATLGHLDLGGLQGFLGLPHGADRSRFRNGGDEPVSLVVATEELLLLTCFAHEQQQVAVAGLNVQHFDRGLGSRWSHDLEELPLAVGLNVQRDGSRSGSNTASSPVRELQPCPHAGKLVVEQVGIHDKDDTFVVRQVRICRRKVFSVSRANAYAEGMRIATYNVNGIKSRLSNLLSWLEREQPDVACLQELKAPDAAFPSLAIAGAGYTALAKGQRSWNGVAILARGTEIVPIRDQLPGDPADDHSRYLEATVGGLVVASIYLPNGNPQPGPKFDYKLK